jgi:hypothetical protein
MPWGISVTADDEIWICGSSPHWWFRHGVYPEYKDQLFMRFALTGRPLQTWALRLGDIGTDKDHPDTSRLQPGETVGAHCIATDSKKNVYIGDIYGERATEICPRLEAITLPDPANGRNAAIILTVPSIPNDAECEPDLSAKVCADVTE